MKTCVCGFLLSQEWHCSCRVSGFPLSLKSRNTKHLAAGTYIYWSMKRSANHRSRSIKLDVRGKMSSGCWFLNQHQVNEDLSLWIPAFAGMTLFVYPDTERSRSAVILLPLDYARGTANPDSWAKRTRGMFDIKEFNILWINFLILRYALRATQDGRIFYKNHRKLNCYVSYNISDFEKRYADFKALRSCWAGRSMNGSINKHQTVRFWNCDIWI